MGQNNSTPSSSSSNSNTSAYRSARRAVNASSSSSPSSSSAPPPSHSHLSPSSNRPLHQGHAMSMNHSSDSSTNPGRSSPQQQQQQQQQQASSSSSRVLRSTAERRRRANLFSSFYPLLSRGSSSNASNQPVHDTPTPVQSPSATSTTNVSSSNSPRVHGDVNVHITNNNNVSVQANHQRPDRPPSRTGASSSSSGIPRVSTRSPGLQAPSPSGSPSGRTPRGLSRVQRMYDEQSIRSSTRSSSRASSLVAVAPPVSAPMTAQAPSGGTGAEPMDVDTESFGQHASPPQTPNSHLYPHDLHPAATGAGTADHTQILHQESNAAAPSRYVAARTRSRSRVAAASIASGSDNLSLYTTLSNPRGGTSISSSLFPIRPDSDDEMDDFDMEQDSPSTQGQPSSRVRGGIGAEMVADLIHRQLMQSLNEEGGHTPAQSDVGGSSLANSAVADESAPTPTMTATASAADRAPAAAHRRRLRSSSMRGLLGFQPTDTLGAEERSEDDALSSGGSTETRPEGSSTEGRQAMSEEQFEFMLGFPFLTRLLASSRLRPEPSATSSGDSATEGPTEDATPPTSTAATTDSTTTSSSETNSQTTEPNVTPRPRRHNATIRFIQVGGGIGRHHHHRHRHPGGANRDGAAGSRPEGSQGEEIGEAIIMYLSGPEPESNGEGATAGSDEPESGRSRPRSRSPWIILTLTGPYLSNLLAAGADGESGVSYDDLWMLSNLIGPARPITTTQEAIDNAGFAVGRYEQDYHGIRNVLTLGDGTKCLVCMSEYEEGEDMRALKCKHGFHQECIDKWLTTGANKCPVCRAAAVISEPPPVQPEVTVDAATSEE